MVQWFRWIQRNKEQQFKPVILVTGCSSGLGLALAHALYPLTKYRVVITARSGSVTELRKIFPENERFWVKTLDVTSDKQRTALIHEIRGAWDGVNILVNNAGIAYRSVLEHMTDTDEQLQMDTNYLGPASLIRQVLPFMRKQGRGKIINISSVSGMLAMPTMASYSASKYALEGMSEALWYETRPLGINVSLIQPGFIRSNSFKRVHYSRRSSPEIERRDPTYRDYYANMTPFVERLMNMSLTTPESMARLVLRVIATENPPLWIPATWDATIFSYLRRMIPRRLLLPLLFACLPGARHWGKGYTNSRLKRASTP